MVAFPRIQPRCTTRHGTLEVREKGLSRRHAPDGTASGRLVRRTGLEVHASRGSQVHRCTGGRRMPAMSPRRRVAGRSARNCGRCGRGVWLERRRVAGTAGAGTFVTPLPAIGRPDVQQRPEHDRAEENDEVPVHRCVHGAHPSSTHRGEAPCVVLRPLVDFLQAVRRRPSGVLLTDAAQRRNPRSSTSNRLYYDLGRTPRLARAAARQP